MTNTPASPSYVLSIVYMSQHRRPLNLIITKLFYMKNSYHLSRNVNNIEYLMKNTFYVLTDRKAAETGCRSKLKNRKKK